MSDNKQSKSTSKTLTSVSKFKCPNTTTIKQLLLPFIAKSIESMIETSYLENDFEAIQQDNSIFYNKDLPEKSILEYLQRLAKYSKADISTLVIMSIYVDRIVEDFSFVITEYNAYRYFYNYLISIFYRILSSALIAAIKYNEDIIYSNNYYSKICGVSLNEFNQLESSFLEYIDYSLYIDSNYYLECFDYFKSSI